MKKSQYISPACNVVNIDVECQFLAGSIVDGGSGTIKGNYGTTDPNKGVGLDVKGAGNNVWNEW